MIDMRGVDDVDAVVVVRNCGPEISRKLYTTIASLIGKGAYRFAIRVEGHSFEECLDTIRDVIQSFIAASFIVVNGSYKLRSRSQPIIVE